MTTTQHVTPARLLALYQALDQTDQVEFCRLLARERGNAHKRTHGARLRAERSKLGLRSDGLARQPGRQLRRDFTPTAWAEHQRVLAHGRYERRRAKFAAQGLTVEGLVRTYGHRTPQQRAYEDLKRTLELKAP